MKYNCREHEMKIRPVELGEVFIDRHEVTVDQYRACVDAGACAEPDSCSNDPIANWKHSGRGDHPVNCVGFRQAVAYCAWVGKRLPTEAEFEKAARGPDGRLFPWGDQEADCRYAAMQDEDGTGCGKGRTSSVCSRTVGNSPYGVCDLAGNLWEWVVDTKGNAFPALDPDGKTRRALRGGAITNSAAVLRSSLRFYVQDVRVPDARGGDFTGFRCVYLKTDYTR
jgi:formylglycine-generating enzyme required for sulfatase activity